MASAADPLKGVSRSVTACGKPSARGHMLDPIAVSQKSKGAWWIGLVLVMMGVAWLDTFVQMWARWYPGWSKPGLTFYERLSTGDSYYPHGPLVVVVSVTLAVFVYCRVGLPVKRTGVAGAVGAVLLGVSLVVHLLSIYAGVMFTSGLALIGALAGLLLVGGGMASLRAYGAPVLLLLFMVPLPMVWISEVNYALKIGATEAAVWLVNHGTGMPVETRGGSVMLAGPGGVPQWLMIDNACSGLRSLIALTWFGALLAVVLRLCGLWRWCVVALALPLAVVCNVIRIALLLVGAHYWGVSAVGEQTSLHHLIGLAAFGAAMMGLIGFEKLVLAVGRGLKRDWEAPGLLAFLNRIESPGNWRAGFVGIKTAFVIALTVCLSVWLVHAERIVREGPVQWSGVPASITLDQQLFQGTDAPMDSRVEATLGTPNVLYRRYTDERRLNDVDLLVVYHSTDRQAIHPPEVCLTGGGSRLLSQRGHTVEMDGGGALPFQELIIEGASQTAYHLYTYRSAGDYSTSYTAQQARVLMNSLWGADRSGALIRLSVPVHDGDVQAARGLALAAAGRIMPHVEAVLR